MSGRSSRLTGRVARPCALGGCDGGGVSCVVDISSQGSKPPNGEYQARPSVCYLSTTKRVDANVAWYCRCCSFETPIDVLEKRFQDDDYDYTVHVKRSHHINKHQKGKSGHFPFQPPLPTFEAFPFFLLSPSAGNGSSPVLPVLPAPHGSRTPPCYWVQQTADVMDETGRAPRWDEPPTLSIIRPPQLRPSAGSVSATNKKQRTKHHDQPPQSSHGEHHTHMDMAVYRYAVIYRMHFSFAQNTEHDAFRRFHERPPSPIPCAHLIRSILYSQVPSYHVARVPVDRHRPSSSEEQPLWVSPWTDVTFCKARPQTPC